MELLSGGLPSSPAWLYAVPIIGQTLADYWNSWAADLSEMVSFFRPYFGVIAETGVGLLLGIAGGVLQFLLALLILSVAVGLCYTLVATPDDLFSLQPLLGSR